MSANDRLVDSWREANRTLDNALIFIRQHQRKLADPDATFQQTAYARFMLPKLIVQYHDALRRVSEAQEKMDLFGIEYSTDEV